MSKEIKQKLQKLKDLGYIKVAFSIEYKKPLFLDILIIHSSWKEYSFKNHFEQAMKDIETCLGEPVMCSLEIPTLEMYQNERNPDAPIHQHEVFDLIPS